MTELDVTPSFRQAGAPATARESPASAPVDKQTRVRLMVEQHFDRVWRFLRRLGLPDDAADDASQEVFTIAARKLDVILEGGEHRYLFGIAANVAAESRRLFARQQALIAREAVSGRIADNPQPDELLDQKRARQALEAAIEGMPMEVRVAFVAFEIEGMTAPEIAEMLDVPLGTVASRVRRGREHFRTAATRFQRARKQ